MILVGNDSSWEDLLLADKSVDFSHFVSALSEKLSKALALYRVAQSFHKRMTIGLLVFGKKDVT